MSAPEKITSELGMTRPLVAASMAGGPSSAALVKAAAHAGGIGFLAGGYKDADTLAQQIADVRSATDRFGVNLFSPNPIPVNLNEFNDFVQLVRPYAAQLGINLETEQPIEDDDGWTKKIALLLDEPVPLVSFMFGLPPEHIIQELHRRGTRVAQTVTTVDEAKQSYAAGVDVVIVQGPDAGGHSGTFTPDRAPSTLPLLDLVQRVREAVPVPIWAAGGITTAQDVQNVLSAGAEAAVVGTALVRTPESGAVSAHKNALGQPTSGQVDRGDPVLTTVFSGRPARALPNDLIAQLSAHAPLGYPAVLHLMNPIRMQAAAAGDAERIGLWAGTGYLQATEEPLQAIFERLHPQN